MGFFMRMQMALSRFMMGRNGMDRLAYHAMWGSVIFSLLSFFLPVGFISTVLLVYAVFRILSRSVARRQAENRVYLLFLAKIRREVQQFFARLKGRKTHKYFCCPSCRSRLRMKRGSGEKTITCPVCSHQFTRKA